VIPLKDNYSLEEYALFNNEETIEMLNNRIMKLIQEESDENFRKVASLRYGLEDRKPLTVKELSKEMKMPVKSVHEYVVKVEKKVFNMLKKDILD
jgi:DNA-directed RNA polymerase sigma subunit (sigma70/sigma32)